MLSDVRTHERSAARDGDTSRAPERVAYACALPGERLLLAGSFQPGERIVPPRDVPWSSARRLLFQRAGGAEGEVGYLAVIELERQERTIVDLGGHAVLFDPGRADLVDAQALGALALAGAGTAVRADATGFVAKLQPYDADPRSARTLALELRAFRDAVRERPPGCQIAVEQPQGLFIEILHRIDERGFYVRGWMRDASAEITGLTAISPEGARAELLGGVVRFRRPDVEDFYGASADERATARSGFVAYFELDAPSHLPDGWVFELRNSNDMAVEAPAPTVLDDDVAARSAVLHDLVHEPVGGETLVRDHAFPALSKLQDRRAREGAIDSVTQYGTPPEDPDVTIVVPLYQRIDFLEHQLAHWVHDPDLLASDLVYVLDSPEQADALHGYAQALHRLYGVPFRTVVLRRNVGYALANNAGVSVARGRLLLLLNSDVLPGEPGWLSTMVRFLDETPGAGAVGPKLVYEDESIQHGGMYFVRHEGSPWWENAHYFKGLHRSFPPANVRRVVPAATGACLLLPMELWTRIGGLKGSYVQGDYEDSDLCLRLADLGYQTWYLPEAELFHLEGQSYQTDLRRLTSRFNTWLHTHLWDARISDLMHTKDVP